MTTLAPEARTVEEATEDEATDAEPCHLLCPWCYPGIETQGCPSLPLALCGRRLLGIPGSADRAVCDDCAVQAYLHEVKGLPLRCGH